MIDTIEIRESTLDDVTSLENLYPSAFPDEDLLPLVRALLEETSIVLSLVGLADETLVGHVIFTDCGIAGNTEKVSLLGPLCVLPAWQRQGIGKTLIRAGLNRLAEVGISRVCVLGDPAYYARFGFESEDGITPPYPLPEKWRGAWQSLSLRDDIQPISGKLVVPGPWCRQALWLP